MVCYRPISIAEFKLVYEGGMRGFPPRKPDQPIFYPVLDRRYACEIAEKWNATSGEFAGFVTEFHVNDEYARRFPRRQVGEARHAELWVPAEQLDEFNRNIAHPIHVVDAFFGKSYRGLVPEKFGLKGRGATEQIAALARTLRPSPMDFRCEVLANCEAVFINFAFWKKRDACEFGITTEQLAEALAMIETVFSEVYPDLKLPLTGSERGGE